MEQGLAYYFPEHCEHIRQAIDACASRGVPIDAVAQIVTGRGRQQLIGRGIWECFPEARATTFHAHYRRAWETGEPVAFPAYYEPLRCWLQVKAYRSAEALAVYLQDVTRERTEQEQLLLLRTAVSRLNDIVIITEAEPQEELDGPKILYVNEAFERRTLPEHIDMQLVQGGGLWLTMVGWIRGYPC